MSFLLSCFWQRAMGTSWLGTHAVLFFSYCFQRALEHCSGQAVQQTAAKHHPLQNLWCRILSPPQWHQLTPTFEVIRNDPQYSGRVPVKHSNAILSSCISVNMAKWRLNRCHVCWSTPDAHPNRSLILSLPQRAAHWLLSGLYSGSVCWLLSLSKPVNKVMPCILMSLLLRPSGHGCGHLHRLWLAAERALQIFYSGTPSNDLSLAQAIVIMPINSYD